jgi:hypothetical protein
MPKALGGTRTSAPVRLSLGACSYQRARLIADILAAEARLYCVRLLARMQKDGESKTLAQLEDILSGETPEENLIAMKTFLKMKLHEINQPAPAPSTEQQVSNDAFKSIVRISREQRAQDEGLPFDKMLAENAELLTKGYNEKLRASLTGSVASTWALGPKSSYVETLPVPASSASQASSPTPIPDAQETPQRFEPARLAFWVQELEDRGIRPAAQSPQAFDLDRRYVPRARSRKPLFSTIAETYFAAKSVARATNKQTGIEQFRVAIFIELIGDHPADTYTGSDLQAFVNALKYWPGSTKDRIEGMTTEETIIDNLDLHLKPTARKTIEDGYLSIVKTIIKSGTTSHEYSNPVQGVKIAYPDTAAATISVESLSAAKISRILATGVASGLMDEAMLPLLGLLTGRRLGLLTYLMGSDIKEKFPGVFVARTDGIILKDGVWQRVPYKTDASLSFFTLHRLFSDIGFIDWARSIGSDFIFPELQRLEDPSKSASSYMRRLFERAGIEKSRQEVFHSLRGGFIDTMREAAVDGRSARLQTGHQVGTDEHELYGSKALGERSSRELSKMILNPHIDFSVYFGLDFAAMHQKKRTAGKRREGPPV